ncbi:unnamed protein product [Trichobilharzia szidati]|nr:unnamed protein product [Trichobilharzia szidati]
MFLLESHVAFPMPICHLLSNHCQVLVSRAFKLSFLCCFLYILEWNFLSQPSVARNDLISVQMNTNQTPNLPKLSSHQSDVFRSSSGGRVSTSSSNTPISNSMSSTPGSASIGSLLPRSPPVQKTDKTIPPSQDETVTATKTITIPIELDKPQHDIIGDKLPPVSSQNVTFNPLTSDSVTCYSLPHPHHLSKPYMNVGIPSENPIDIYYPNNESDEIGDMYSNYGKKSYDYFATDSVLLVRSSRRRKIRPDLQGNENDSSLSSISSSTTAGVGVGAGAPVASTVLASTSPATVVVHTIGPSGMISKSSMTTDCCSSVACVYRNLLHSGFSDFAYSQKDYPLFGIKGRCVV